MQKMTAFFQPSPHLNGVKIGLARLFSVWESFSFRRFILKMVQVVNNISKVGTFFNFVLGFDFLGDWAIIHKNISV
jgi:hypothetical protein